ncbi:MAG: hypothetical protein QN173_01445 [Armatimonadota bacterium]|nr:hypothetical protein [Armatimonadota bacterium]MDR7401125.1 hypothetical protein [Armatimonadota bacterium]MDR7404325.1 hypothetical protein [Armatimonadota bacterium]MDR7436420.1 hypothetical protein [Armatimonadota bacterium]MDR7471778.1 hypothetical protein [Armatimonadota bacterium]
MHGPYGLNNIADQLHQDAQAAADRHRLAMEAEAEGARAAAARYEGLRRLVSQLTVAARWAVRTVLG